MDKMRKALKQAVEVIKGWHGETVFDLYYKNAPEMKLIREALDVKEHSIEADAEGRCTCEYPYIGLPGCPKCNPSKLTRTA